MSDGHSRHIPQLLIHRIVYQPKQLLARCGGTHEYVHRVRALLGGVRENLDGDEVTSLPRGPPRFDRYPLQLELPKPAVDTLGMLFDRCFDSDFGHVALASIVADLTPTRSGGRTRREGTSRSVSPEHRLQVHRVRQ